MAILDLFRLKLRNTDPEVRADAVRRLSSDEVETLGRVIRDDEDGAIRRLALKKLNDAATLAEIASAHADESLRKLAADKANAIWVALAAGDDEPKGLAAVAKLTEPAALASVAKAARIETIRTAALARVNDPKALADIARNATEATVRLAALSQVTSVPTLRAIAAGDDSEEVALAAVERLDDPDALEAIAQKSKRRAAKKRAAEKLVAADAGPRVTANKQRRTKQRELVHATELAAESREWGAAALKLEEARDAWKDLGVDARADLRERFDRACESFHSRRAAHDAARIAREAAAATGSSLTETVESASAPPSSDHSAIAAATEADDQPTAQRPPRVDVEKLVVDAETAAAARDLKEARRAFERLRRDHKRLDGRLSDALEQRFVSAGERLAAREAEVAKRDEQRLKQNFLNYEKLCAQLEELAVAKDGKDEAEQLSLAVSTLSRAQSALKSPKPLPRESNGDALKKRLEEGIHALHMRVQELREADEWKRWANEPLREDLCVKAEKLAEETDLRKVAKGMQELEKAWREVGPVKHDKAGPLRERFRKAMSETRSRCEGFFKEQDAERKENLQKKLELCVKAEAIKDSTDWKQTSEDFKALQAEWKGLGPAPKAKADAVWKRFRAACDSFFERRNADLKKLDTERSGHLARKEELCIKAEALADSTDWDTTANELKRLQAEWKKTGPAPRAKADAIWKRFRGAADRFFDRHSRRDQIEIDDRIERLLELTNRVETLANEAVGTEEADARTDIADSVKELMAERRSLSTVPGRLAEDAHARFDEAVGRIVERQPESFQGTEFDPETRHKKRETLCKRIETMADRVEKELVKETARNVGDMAAQLRSALAANAFRGAEGESKWTAVNAELDEIRSAWNRVRTLTDARGKAQDERFRTALHRVEDARNQAQAR